MHPKVLASICLALLAVASVAVAETDPELRTLRSVTLPPGGADWPTWSGPEGNLTSLGNGIFDSGDAGDGGAFGLERVWSRPLGSAYSGIVVVDGRLVTTFSDGESDHLVALDASTGTELWRYRISDTYEGHDGSDDGPLATPSIDGGIDGGVVYGLGARGELFAVSLREGKERWRLDLVADYGAVKPSYGFATAPTVIGDLLVVETGGDDGRSISAFDRATGELRWSTGDDPVAYQSPLAFGLGGEPSLVAVTSRSLLGLAPETGKVLWRHQHTEGDRRAFGSAQPVPVGEDGILLTASAASALFQVSKNAEGYTVEEAWRSRALRNSLTIPVPYEGYLYGYAGNFLTCVDAATGETVWKSRPPGPGELALVDGHLVILLARSGEIVVAEATPEAYREVSRVKALDRGYYTRPSFAGGKVYVRNLTDISAIGVTEASSSRSADANRSEPNWDLRGDFGAFVQRLAVAPNKREMIERFLAEHPTMPILEGPSHEGPSHKENLVHFVYHGEVEDLAVSGNFIRDGSEHAMHRVEGTDFYFRSYALPEKAVFTYQFAVFEERIPDPANPLRTGPEGSERSVLATAGWKPPSHLREPEGKRGSIEALLWKSEQLDDEREVQIYLPPGYDKGDGRYPLLVVNNCDQALAIGKMDKSLDNLIGKTVAPVIVAFVPAIWPELGGSGTAEYTRAQAEELIPLIDKTFRTDARRESRAVMGQSIAYDTGFAAMYLALHHPETFSRAAAQSYRRGQLEEDLMAAASGEKHDLELMFHWSSYDRLDPVSDVDARRDAKKLVAALAKNGYSPKVFESDDGVGWGMWQGRMAEILAALFPLE